MSDLKELYQEMILDHNRSPRNFRVLTEPTCRAEGFNPLCGDQITIFVKLLGDRIQEVCFQGSGCAISKSSGSLMTVALKGKTLQEAETLFQQFHEMLIGKSNIDQLPELGKLAIFSGVCEFPSRVKCATLAWHTFRSALEGKESTVSTEEEDKNA